VEDIIIIKLHHPQWTSPFFEPCFFR